MGAYGRLAFLARHAESLGSFDFVLMADTATSVAADFKVAAGPWPMVIPMALLGCRVQPAAWPVRIVFLAVDCSHRIKVNLARVGRQRHRPLGIFLVAKRTIIVVEWPISHRVANVPTTSTAICA